MFCVGELERRWRTEILFITPVVVFLFERIFDHLNLLSIISYQIFFLAASIHKYSRICVHVWAKTTKGSPCLVITNEINVLKEFG